MSYIYISDIHPSTVVPHNSELPFTPRWEQTTSDIQMYGSYTPFTFLLLFFPFIGMILL